MYQNKIEKFTDRLFLKSTTSRSPINNLSLNFKTLSPCNKWKQTEENLKQHSGHRSNFRHSREQLGLSKTDIDKLELMCADLTAQDYLNKLIKIHEEENAMKDEVEIFGIGQEYMEQIDHEKASSEDKKTNNQNEMSQQTQKLFDTEKDDEIDNLMKIIVKPEKTDTTFQKTQTKQKEGRKTTVLPNTSAKNTQFLFVTKSPGKQSYLKKKSIIPAASPKKTLLKNDGKVKQDQQKKQGAQTAEDQDKKNMVRSMKVSNSSPYLPSDQVDSGQGKNAFQKSDEQANLEENDGARLYHKQFEQKQVSDSKKLEEICYSQIGKRMVVVHQKQVRRQFFKTNLHIRSYIIKNIISYIQCFAEYSPNSIFIFPNERAIHFQAIEKPRELETHIEHTKYVEIIKNVNHIIQKNIFKQKYKQKTPSTWPYAMLIMFLLLMLMLGLIFFVGDESSQLKNIFMVCTGLLICIILVVLIASSLHCYSNKMNFIPVCEIICQDIDSYFKFVNGKMENNLEWIVGQSFYWLEVKIHENGYNRNANKKYRHKKGRSGQVYGYRNQEDEIIEQK